MDSKNTPASSWRCWPSLASHKTIRSGANKKVRKVADLVASERLGCRTGDDLSLRLVGLSYYNEPQWKNDLGETWSVERMIEEEIAKPIATAPEGGLNRLLGLSYAVAEQRKHDRPIKGPFRRAEKFTAITSVTPRDAESRRQLGTVFPGRSRHERRSGHAVAIHRSGAGMLAMSLSEKQLEDPKVVGAVNYLVQLLGNSRFPLERPVANDPRDRRDGPRPARLDDV